VVPRPREAPSHGTGANGKVKPLRHTSPVIPILAAISANSPVTQLTARLSSVVPNTSLVWGLPITFADERHQIPAQPLPVRNHQTMGRSFIDP
jgi:hypothetical protein